MQLPQAVTVAEALAAVERCQFFVDRGKQTERAVVHCYIGTFGADWDAQAAIDVIEANPDQLVWADSFMGPCLKVTDESGKAFLFDTVNPPTDAESEAP